MLSFILLASSSPMSAIGALIMPFATGTLYGLMSLGRKVGVLHYNFSYSSEHFDHTHKRLIESKCFNLLELVLRVTTTNNLPMNPRDREAAEAKIDTLILLYPAIYPCLYLSKKAFIKHCGGQLSLKGLIYATSSY